VKAWLTGFLDAVEIAVEQASWFARELDDLRAQWAYRHARHRAALGMHREPRSGSAAVRLLDQLPEVPLVTARTAARLLGVSFTTARAATEELTSAGVLTSRDVERHTTGYFAREVFDLLTFTERRLASTSWDTRRAEPRRPVPALPVGRAQ
jgi:Fic family protein